MEIKTGIIKRSIYDRVTGSDIFKELESASDSFIKLKEELFSDFSKQWVKDSFHQWSRQYEYPFVYECIAGHSDQTKKILDAGSGITFFPYFLKSKYDDIKIECCDNDEKLIDQFRKVNKRTERTVNYYNSDIRNLKRADAFYDAIYCISVLEHTNLYEEIVVEFARILKPKGRLIITFDISLDGSADIPVEKANQLLKYISLYFDPIESTPLKISNINDDILSTRYIHRKQKHLLPWKYPYLMFFKSLASGKVPRSLIRDLTCFCGVFEKK